MFQIVLYAVALLLSVPLLAQNPTSPNSGTEQAEQSSASNSPDTNPVVPDSTELLALDTREPEYPEAARRQNIRGEVTAMILVSESGDVENVHPLTGDPVLISPAIEAMRHWKFGPYNRGGHPVAAIAKVTFTFGAQGTGDSNASTWTVNSQISNPTVMSPTVRMSQGVTQGMALRKVAPRYPKAARKARVQGRVVIAGTISKEGTLKNLRVLSGPPELVDAALDAVRQWLYRPYVFMGRPVEVDTQITVNFTLTGG